MRVSNISASPFSVSFVRMYKHHTCAFLINKQMGMEVVWFCWAAMLYFELSAIYQKSQTDKIPKTI